MDEIADDLEGSRIDELRYSPGQPIDDPIIASLGASLRPVLGHPAQLNPMFLEYVAYALGAHVAQTYGGMAAWSTPRKGGLAPWQEKRAKEIMAARLDGPLLREMAQQCGLSVGHFSRAFRATTGVAPHQWLIQRRVEAAKDLLWDRRMPLSEVALACGFADQSHFTRTFSRATGLSPGAWRRNIHH